MRWQGRRQSSNIEDRRGQGGGFPGGMGGGLGGGMGPRIRIPGGMRVGGGGGAGSIIVILIVIGIIWLSGGNVLDMLGGGMGGSSFSPTGQQTTGEVGTPSDEAGQFVASILADTEDAWTQIFAAEGARYQPPTLVLFEGTVASACGYATAAVGPFYCPGDRKVYIDLAFYDELRTRFQAPGDFAEAYVIAHEIGHHVQNLLGTMSEVNGLRERSSEADANRLSVRLELQADCYAGIWAQYVDREGILDAGDIDEALNAASQIGDDALQMRTQGYVVPDSFNHGTSEQRSRWFKRGYSEGSLAACDTFSAQNV